MTVPRSLHINVYWPSPDASLRMSFVRTEFKNVSAPAPLTVTAAAPAMLLTGGGGLGAGAGGEALELGDGLEVPRLGLRRLGRPLRLGLRHGLGRLLLPAPAAPNPPARRSGAVGLARRISAI